MIESLKAKEVSSDFFADQGNFKARMDVFKKYFVSNSDELLIVPLDYTCEFIKAS